MFGWQPSEVYIAIVTTLIAGGIMIHLAMVRRQFRLSDKIQADHTEAIVHLQRNAVMKEDWIRETAVNRQRLDAMAGKLDEIRGRDAVISELASAIASAKRTGA